MGKLLNDGRTDLLTGFKSSAHGPQFQGVPGPPAGRQDRLRIRGARAQGRCEGACEERIARGRQG
ncbi:hypothetical protein ACTMU2_37845 [Cupriavidus basilensis]